MSVEAVLHNSAENLPLFYISGGRIGTQIHLSPVELAKSINAKFEDITL